MSVRSVAIQIARHTEDDRYGITWVARASPGSFNDRPNLCYAVADLCIGNRGARDGQHQRSRIAVIV